MLVKVSIKTDIKGKHYIHNKKKVYIKPKCIKLLPKKDEFNIYVKDDGVKYYHIGYRKVYLGNDIEVSKNICDEMEAVISHKKKKIDKVITDSITQIKEGRKRKRQRKGQRKEAIIKVGQNVISRADRELEKKAENAEDFSSRQKKPSTFAQTRAKLIAMNDKTQQVKRDAYEKGLPPAMVARAVNEAKVFMTTPKDDLNSNDFSVLNSMYKLDNDIKLDKLGVPIFKEREQLKQDKDDLEARYKKQLEERDYETISILEEPIFFLPEKQSISIDITKSTKISDLPKTSTKTFNVKTGEEEEVVKLPTTTKKVNTFSLLSPKLPSRPRAVPTPLTQEEEDEDEDEDEDEEAEQIEEIDDIEPEGKAIPLAKPYSNQKIGINQAEIELQTRLLEIQDYQDVDAGYINSYKDHLKILNQDTDVEKSGLKKVKSKIDKIRRNVISDYKQYMNEKLTYYVERSGGNTSSFDMKTIKFFGAKRAIDSILKRKAKVKSLKLKAPKSLNDYEELNNEVDKAKKDIAYRTKAVKQIIEVELRSLKLEYKKQNKQEFNEYTLTLIDKYSDNQNVSSIPSSIYDYLISGKTKEALESAVIRNNTTHITKIRPLDETAEDLYKNPAFDEKVFKFIQSDIKKNFPETPSNVFNEYDFQRAYYGDKLDEATPQPKQSASVKNAFTVSFGSNEPVNTNIPAHHQVVDTNAIIQEDEEEEEEEEGEEGKEEDEEAYDPRQEIPIDDDY